jgi:hypothetical protein
MTAKEFENIVEVLDLIAAMNINRCTHTTYDLSIQECARYEIIQGLARHYGIEYRMQPTSEQPFPVKTTKR